MLLQERERRNFNKGLVFQRLDSRVISALLNPHVSKYGKS